MQNDNKNNQIVSYLPFSKNNYFANNTNWANDTDRINTFIKKNNGRKIVVVQGLGFVGSAMLTAIAAAKNEKNLPLYAVIGVDLADISSYWKITMVNEGSLPIKSTDNDLLRIFKQCFKSGNIMATASKYAYQIADIVIVNIGLDVKKYKFGDNGGYNVILGNFISSIRKIAGYIKPSCLVIVESTLPPGTCQDVLLPIFISEFKKRGFSSKYINLAYSYERVMPGKDYLKSIVSYHRVFSGINTSSKRKARLFLSSIINTQDYPLTELDNTTAVEMGKVLENSYRAVNIAFIQEWTEFAELAKIDLFKVIKGIRKRKTHNNIMLPGFGVGGYCLTKDSLLADWSIRKLFRSAKRMNMTINAVNINDNMPLHSFNLLKMHLKKIKGKQLLIMGISYRKDVADTRFSPSAIFYKKALEEGAKIMLYDPLVDYWPEFNIPVVNNYNLLTKNLVDAVILTVDHDICLKMSPKKFAGLVKPNGLIIDCNNIINDRKASLLRKKGFKLVGVGKGHWNKL